MPSAVSGPREDFGSSTVKMEGMNDARNQKWEEKKKVLKNKNRF